MPELPRHVRLSGGDHFFHAIDRRMRRTGIQGNVCRIAIRLEPGLKAEMLRHRLEASPFFKWLSRVRLIRRLPPFPAIWQAAAQPAGILHEHESNGTSADGLASLPPAAVRRNLRPDQNPALAFDLVRYRDGSVHLLYSWHHALMDLRGAELLLHHLREEGRTADLSDLLDPAQTGSNWLVAGRDYLRQARLARGSVEVLNTVCREPLFSLVPATRPAGRCRDDCRVMVFTEEETTRLDAHCERLNASFRRSSFYLAATLQSVHRIASRRGNQHDAYLVPVPHEVRRRGACGPIFSNRLTFLFHRIEPRQAGNMTETLSALRHQMTDQIRQGSPEAFLAALELFKPMPLGWCATRLSHPTQGKVASFFFSDAGETCAGIDDLFGTRITAVTHLAPGSRPPGLTVVFSRFRGRLSVTLAWVEDCLSPDEVSELELGLRRALLGECTE